MSIFILFLRILIVIFLYSFIFWALKANEESFPERKSKDSRSTRKNVLIISRSSGTVHRFLVQPITIGRHPSSDLFLEDDAISLRHVRISFKDGNWWIADLNSKNGTYLNSNKIFDRELLTENDEIRIGNDSFVISWD